ncbi:MAG: acetyl-CoA hydrolase/transferase family protein [Alistipes sp.]|nr:acetyl-CoA hydrolase/transferase family protein [Alistipes sp.]
MKYMTAAEAVRLIRSGDSVYVQGSTSIPEVLVRAMTDRAPELRGVKVYSAFAIGREDAPYARRELIDSFEAVSFFVANNVRRAIREGVAQTIPAFLGEIPFLFRSGQVPLDVCLLNVSEPDEEGYCSFGISADLAVSAAECSKTIIAQVNRYMPRTFGDPVIHISKIAALVRGDEPLVELPTVTPNDIERRIGGYIAAEIPDGATMQIGVGGIPNAVLDALHDHKHLGLHTEAMTDGVVPLIEKGIIDNSQKRILPGKSVASLVLGSRRLYDYLDNNRDVEIRDVAWTNDPAIIRQNPRVMAVNSAIEVDLTGQICADSIGEVIFSGVGGQHDFMYGGSLSEGGKCFIALPSMTGKGLSKIVPTLARGAGVVTTRFQAQYIVTEYGAAYLRNKNLAERARALIGIAHPSVREELERAATERFGIGFLRTK